MTIRLRIRKFAAWLFKRTQDPPPDQSSVISKLNDALVELSTRHDARREDFMDRVSELAEARAMAGIGPWSVGPETIRQTDALLKEAFDKYGKVGVRESINISAQGAYGDIELALQNVDWRREVNLAWIQFSRWGIQQIILISRLYYIKNPIIRRLIDVCAAYVFARGVEVTTNDDAANEVLKDFFERNKTTLGQQALTDLERRKDYDGNIFFVLFPDTQDKGITNCRTIDATEIQEIVTAPGDQDTPWFYKRVWTERAFDYKTGQSGMKSMQAWYPALGHDPQIRESAIGGILIEWERPILHRKAGAVAKWLFGCPRIYPALDWAREGRKNLEAQASVDATLAQIALTITTKGGQQALQGIKQQMGTSVGPTGSIWDQNPPAVAGATFASGPGTSVEAFKRAGTQGNTELFRQIKLMCCMVAGIPETFLADVSTGNLATATSLDRPTETVFLEKQEAWREDLLTLARSALKTAQGAPSGRLRECQGPIVECRRKALPDKRWVYEAFGKPKDGLEVRVNFPAIREGDIPSLVQATVAATTLGQQGTPGIDLKTAVRKLFDLLGIENGDEITEQMFPDATYNPDRTAEEEPETGDEPVPEDPAAVEESKAIRRALRRIVRASEAHAHTH